MPFSAAVFEDKGGTFAYEDVVADKGIDWRPFSTGDVNFGYSSSTFWIKIDVASSAHDDLVLLLKNPLLDQIDFYYTTTASKIGHMEAGFLRPVDVNQHSDVPYFSTSLQAKNGPYLLQVRSAYPILLPLSIVKSSEFSHAVIADEAIYGLIYGILFLMALYNLMIFGFIRDRSYLYYSLYVFFLTCMYLSVEGHITVLFPALSVALKSRAVYVAGPLTFIFLLLFVRRLFTIDNKWTMTAWRGLVLCLVLLLGAGLVLGGQQVLGMAANVLTSACVLFLLGFALAHVGKKDVAPFFLFGFSGFLVGVVLYNLQMNGAITRNFLTIHGSHFGSIFEIMSFSLALAFRINVLNRQLHLRSDDLRSAHERLKTESDTRLRIASELETHKAIAVHLAKLKAIGELAAGIAHEINNPLAIMSVKTHNFLELVGQSDVEPGLKGDLATYGNDILAIGGRMKKIVGGLLRYARRTDQEIQTSSNVNDLVDDTLSLCREKFLQSNIRFYLDLPGDMAALCVRTEISQILLNLLNNAFDALEGQAEGRISIVAREHDDVVTIAVSDSGGGIPESIKSKIMQPFFTTKPEGHGTGIGLSISADLAAKNGGRLYLEVDAAETTFVVELPRAPLVAPEESRGVEAA